MRASRKTTLMVVRAEPTAAVAPGSNVGGRKRVDRTDPNDWNGSVVDRVAAKTKTFCYHTGKAGTKWHQAAATVGTYGPTNSIAPYW